VRLSVRLFAGLRERAGAERVEVDVPEDATAADVLRALDLPPRACVVAVNREYAGPNQRVRPGDEVALVPPVSGGAARWRA
jgi:molybdopterin synthase catalytic subunit